MSFDFIEELIGLILIVIVFIVIKLRDDGLSKFSKISGFKKLKNSQKYKQNLPSFKVFYQAPEISSILVKETSNAKIRIIDHQYKAPATQTLLMLESDELSIPDFIITPKKLISSKGIQIENLAKFSSKYKVEGDNEEEIKKILSPEFTNIFLRIKKLNFEAKDNKIIIYRYQKKVKVGKLTDFLTELNELFFLLKNKKI